MSAIPSDRLGVMKQASQHRSERQGTPPAPSDRHQVELQQGVINEPKNKGKEGKVSPPSAVPPEQWKPSVKPAEEQTQGGAAHQEGQNQEVKKEPEHAN